MTPQKTIKKSIKLTGIGVHSSKKSTVVLNPAPVDFGIRIKRKSKIFKCTTEFVTNAVNQVTIGDSKNFVQTVEHILSALKGLSITNCLLEFDSEEAPIIDGSAKPFIDAIYNIGIVEQPKSVIELKVLNPIWIEDGDKFVIVIPADNFKVTYNISFNHPMLKNQYATFEINEETYVNEISKARTFGFFEDWEYLKSIGLALGSTLENSVVYSKDGLLNNELRYENECVRHKILDLIGDLSLLGYPFKGHVIANRSGHNLDLLLVKKIEQYVLNNRFTKEEIKVHNKIFDKKFSTLIK